MHFVNGRGIVFLTADACNQGNICTPFDLDFSKCNSLDVIPSRKYLLSIREDNDSLLATVSGLEYTE